MADTATPIKPATGPKPTTPSQPSLPYRITSDKFDRAIQTLKQSPGSSDALNVAVGAADRPFITRVLSLLKLAVPSTLELTPEGRRVAFAEGEDRGKAILRAMFGFDPYKIVLMEIAKKKAQSISVLEIASIWGQNNLGQGDDNRGAAATAFAAIAEAAGAGKYVLGRRGSPSRLDLPSNFNELLTTALANDNGSSPIDPSRSEQREKEVDLQRGGDVPKSGFIRYHFPLRADLVIQFDLPTDLTKSDVDRMARWLHTLPFEVTSD